MSTVEHVQGFLFTTTGTSCRVHVDLARDTGRWEIYAQAADASEELQPLGTHATRHEALAFAADVADGRLFLTKYATAELLDGTIRLTFDDDAEMQVGSC